MSEVAMPRRLLLSSWQRGDLGSEHARGQERNGSEILQETPFGGPTCVLQAFRQQARLGLGPHPPGPPLRIRAFSRGLDTHRTIGPASSGSCKEPHDTPSASHSKAAGALAHSRTGYYNLVKSAIGYWSEPAGDPVDPIAWTSYDATISPRLGSSTRGLAASP